MKKIDWKQLLLHIAIPLGVGGLSAFLTKGDMGKYPLLHLPPLAPPDFLFPIVWTVLFILMGISAYLINKTDSPHKNAANRAYWLQLFLNFVWPLIFFKTDAYLGAFVWLVLLAIAVCKMIGIFWRILPTAAKLQIPYLLWTLFAGYLNFAIYLLN